MINLELKALLSMTPVYHVDVCGQVHYKETITLEFNSGAFVFDVVVTSEPVGHALSYIDNGYVTTEHAQRSQHIEIEDIHLLDRDDEEVSLTDEQYAFLEIELKTKILL